MLDPVAINRALGDPTFTVTLSWGEFSLVGKYWSLFLPIVFAAGAFVVVFGIDRFWTGASRHMSR